MLAVMDDDGTSSIERMRRAFSGQKIWPWRSARTDEGAAQREAIGRGWIASNFANGFTLTALGAQALAGDPDNEGSREQIVHSRIAKARARVDAAKAK